MSKDNNYLSKEELLQRIQEIKNKRDSLKEKQNALKNVAMAELKLRKEAEAENLNDEIIKHRDELENKLNEKEEIAKKIDEKIQLKEDIEDLKRQKDIAFKEKQHELEMQRIRRKREQNERLENIRKALIQKKKEKELKDLEEKKKEDAEKLNIEIREDSSDAISSNPPKVKPVVYIISGPTAVGKSSIATMLAKQIDGEIVNCDSVQIYKYLDIGSAKPTNEEMNKVPHHLYDFQDPRIPLTVAEYQRMALGTIDETIERGRTPIICGGTGLYLNSILYDMDFAVLSPDKKRREELEKLASENGSKYLHEYLSSVDKTTAERIHPNNTRKIIRAIEAYELGSNIEPIDKCKPNNKYDFKLFGLTMDRDWLYERINKRTLKLAKNGLIDEVKKLKEMGIPENSSAMKAIGYKEIYSYLEKEITLKEAITDVMKNTRHYAKRQLTWLKRYDDIKWIEINKGDRISGIVLTIIEKANN